MFKKFLTRLKRNAFWKSVATLSTGQILAQAINLVSVPIVSRIYSKDAFGTFTILTSTAIIILSVIKLGLGPAIMVPKDDNDSKIILKSGMYLQITFATLIVLVMFLISPFYKFFNTSFPYYAALIILYLYVVLNAFSTYLTLYINRLGLNRVFFVNSLLGAAFTFVITLGCGFLGFDSVGLLIAAIVSVFVTSIHMVRKTRPFGVKVGFKEIKQVLKTYKDYVIFQYPANLLATFSDQLPNQLFYGQYGEANLGDYTQCNKIFRLPFSVIAVPIQTIYFRTVSKMYREKEDISGFTFLLIARILVVGFVPILIIMCFGEKIFGFVLGAKWTSAGQLAAIAALSFLFTFCSECIAYCRVAINRQRLNLVMSAVQLVIVLASLIAGITFFNSITASLLCYAIANTALQIINISVTFACLKKHVFNFIMLSTAFILLILILTYVFRVLVFKI